MNENKTYKINSFSSGYTAIMTRLGQYFDESIEIPTIVLICGEGFYTLCDLEFTTIFKNMTPCAVQLVEKPQFIFSEETQED